jgi:hypothetical protein
MEKITHRDVRRDEEERPRVETTNARLAFTAGAAIGIKSHGSSQSSPASTEAGTLSVLHPHVWAKALKFHGIRELNSPMAG